MPAAPRSLIWQPVFPIFVCILSLCLTNNLPAKEPADASRTTPALPRITQLSVEPATLSLQSLGEQAQLVVTGKTAGGQLVDLTSAAVIGETDLLQITPQQVAVALKPGRGRLKIQAAGLQMEIDVQVGAEPISPVSFRRDVLPLLTKAGCSMGACHGTPSGKGGFRLSLRGYDHDLDAMTLVREIDGRRINRIEPDRSLVLLKGTLQIGHEGGRRLKRDSVQYRLLRDWIAGGAVTETRTDPSLARLEIFPEVRFLDAPAAEQQLRVVAKYTDGTSRDVTHLSRFSVNEESLAEVDWQGVAHKLRRGEVTVIAEYMNQMASSRLVFLDPVPEFAWQNPLTVNFIDELVFAKLKTLRIMPSGLATDEEFLRRIFLDVIGRLPTIDEAKNFLADASPDKRNRLIETLLERPEFANAWAMKWADRLGCNQRFVGHSGAIKYHAWIRNAMATNMPEDQFVREIVTATGPNYMHPAASFYRRLRDPQFRGEEISQLFMGVRMQCARCHNHLGEKWTQNDYYGLAAFFARVGYRNGPFFNHTYDKEETVLSLRKGELAHPRTGQPVPPKFLGGATPEIPAGVDRRSVFANWLTAADNPFFARVSVNRLWYHLLGRGIVEPLDDFRSTNPPANEPLLQALADEFVRRGFDRKHLLRLILQSRTYQLSSQTNITNAEDDKYFSHARVRLLPAEVLLDAVATATGVPENFANFPAGMSAVSLPDGELKHPFLEAFGRPARAMACECERGGDTNLSQALHLVGGEVVHVKIRNDAGRCARLAGSDRAAADLLEELFLATLSRRPTAKEQALLAPRLTGEPAHRRAALEDILWALLNHNEFLFQH